METPKTTAQLINADSGKVEYYTPDYILDAASEVMGINYTFSGTCRFELDVASSWIGNDYVNSERFFTQEDDGLMHSWTANSVWMNHPYSREFNKQWTAKAVSEYESGNAKQLCMLVWASTSEKWFHPLFKYPICFFDHRLKFIDPGRNLTGATKSSALIYMGKNIGSFMLHFDKPGMGHVMMPTTSTGLGGSIVKNVEAIRTAVDKFFEEMDQD